VLLPKLSESTDVETGRAKRYEAGGATCNAINTDELARSEPLHIETVA